MTQHVFISTKKEEIMVRYTIKLKKTEVEELQKIINKGKHSTQAYGSAYILLNCDKNEHS